MTALDGAWGDSGRRGDLPDVRNDADRSDRPPATAPSVGLAAQLARLVCDIGVPVALYYGLRATGASNLVALSAGTVAPALSATWTLRRTRRVDAVAALMLVTMALSLLGSLVTHDPRFLLAKDGLITGLWGMWFLATALGERPAAFVFARPLMEGRKTFAAGSWDALWAGEPRFRRIWRVSSVLWGSGLVIDGLIRIVMAYRLPVSEVPGLGGLLWPVTFVLLQVVTNAYYHRAGLYRLLGASWTRR